MYIKIEKASRDVVWSWIAHKSSIISLLALTLLLSSCALAFAGGVDSPVGPMFNAARMVQHTEYFDLQEASTLINEEKFPQAIPFLKAAIEKSPTNLLAHFNLGFCYMEWAKRTAHKADRAKLLTLAEDALLRAESLNNRYPITYFKLGKVALLEDNLDKAEQYYLRGLSIEPDNAGLLFNLAGIYDQENRAELAMEYYQKAIAADPEFAFAYNNLGLLYERMKRYDEAEAAYQTALQKDATYLYAQLNLGNLYAEQDRMNDAELAYQKVLRLDPKDPWAHMYLGNIYLKRGDYEKAAKFYELSTRLNPEYATTYYLLAVTLERLQRYDDALSMGLHYLRLSPQGEFSPEVKSLVISLKNQRSATLRLLPHDSLLK